MNNKETIAELFQKSDENSSDVLGVIRTLFPNTDYSATTKDKFFIGKNSQ